MTKERREKSHKTLESEIVECVTGRTLACF